MIWACFDTQWTLINISGWFWNRVLHNDCACVCEGQELYNFSINLYLSMSSRSIMCRGFGTFYVIENKFCKASYECYFVLSVFCKYKTNLADISFFLIWYWIYSWELILSEIKEMHSWIGGIVNGGIMTCFLILWGYLNSRYRVRWLTFQCKYPCR